MQFYDCDKIEQEIDSFISEYYEKYTGLYLKSKNFLRSIKMRKIPGKIISKPIEVGAKFVADDGTEFDYEYDCRHYEAKLKKEEAGKAFNELYEKISKNNVELNIFEMGEIVALFTCEFDTEEELKKAVSIIREAESYLGEDISIYLNDGMPLSSISFPAKFIVKEEVSSGGDCRDSRYFNFYDTTFLKKKLLEDLSTIDKL